ncbi:MAG: hypothetical protein ACM3SQ_14680 [Betaproteobacteria bacterium]
MRTVDFTPLWTVRRVGCVADVSCELNVLLDAAADVPHFAVRVTLNGQALYERIYRRHSEAERDAAQSLKDLVAAGWRDDAGWMCSTGLPAGWAA